MGTDEESQSVAMSQCGTFALVGSAGGCIDLFNMQSGQYRQSFPPRALKPRGVKVNPRASNAKHTKAVTGLMIDSLNRTVVSCSLDGKVKVSLPSP
jgi:U3 small nucleolar RNA-associated protein 21